MLCCTRAVLVQSSSHAAKMSTKSLNRCRSCSAVVCLDAHHFADPTPQQQQQSQVTGKQMECVVLMAGVCWSELQYSSRAPPESLQLLCDGWGLEPVSTDVWATAAGWWPLHGGSGPTETARSRYRGIGRPLVRQHVLPSGPTSPSQQCTHL